MSRAMSTVRAIVKDQRGLAVVLGLVALLSLTALVLAFLSVSAFEPQIAANLAAASQARYLAEAGVEAAFDGLANTANWSDAIAAATCASGAIAPRTAAASPLPGLTGDSGTFTVRVRNDCFPGGAAATRDKVITGLDEDKGGANADTNDRLIITSTGTIGSATKTVKVVVRKISLPPINGALTFPGSRASVDLAGSSFTIRGGDTRMGTDAAGTGAPVYGIAVGVAANLAAVENALAASPQNAVSGKNDTTPGGTATGNHAVAYDPSLTSAAVTAFVNALKDQADVSISSTPASPYAIRDMGATCASSPESPTCFGTVARPKVVYVKGDGSGSYHGLDISGNSTGAGILIIEDASLDVAGTFRWNGPVIVTGRNAKVRFTGGEEHAVWGAVIVNETTAALDAAISGSAKLSYSTDALATVMQNLGARRFMALSAWQEI